MASMAEKKNIMLKWNGNLVKSGNNALVMTRRSEWPSDQLMARWTFNNDDVTDEIGNADFSLSTRVYPPAAWGFDYPDPDPRPVSYQPGHIGNGRCVKTSRNNDFLNGSGLYTQDPSIIAQTLEGKEWSLSTWVFTSDASNPNDNIADIIRISNTQDVPPYSRFWLQNQTSSNIATEIFEDGAPTYAYANDASVLNKWIHYCFTFSKTVATLYIDNSIFYSNAFNWDLDASASSPLNTLRLGGHKQPRHLPDANTDWLLFDNTYFYGKKLRPTEVSKLYNKGNGV